MNGGGGGQPSGGDSSPSRLLLAHSSPLPPPPPLLRFLPLLLPCFVAALLLLPPIVSSSSSALSCTLPLPRLQAQQQQIGQQQLPALSSSSAGPSPPKDPFSLVGCSCEPGWARSFCRRAQLYGQMAAELAPSVCVCRQLKDEAPAGGPGQCVQFLTRCFRIPPPLIRLPAAAAQMAVPVQQHRPSARQQLCSCCFNQPDAFCSQLDCAQMRPQFGPEANTSCLCYFPPAADGAGKGNNNRQQQKGEYPPRGLCAVNKWQRQEMAKEDEEEEESEDDDYDALWEEQQKIASLRPHRQPVPSSAGGPSSRHPQSGGPLSSLFQSRAPLARLVSLLILALLATLAVAIGVCLWSHWRRKRRKSASCRRRSKRQQEEGEDAENSGNWAAAEGEGQEEGRQNNSRENGAPLLLEASL